MWRQLLGDQEPVMGAEPADQRALELGELRPQLPLRQVGQRRRVGRPGDQRRQDLPARLAQDVGRDRRPA